jgi:hypothetical protein
MMMMMTTTTTTMMMMMMQSQGTTEYSYIEHSTHTSESANVEA